MIGQFTESLGTRHRFVGMRVRLLIFILINFDVASLAYAETIPSWIIKGPVSDSTFHYVVCSHDGIDPEEARQIAESKCLASAAKLGGVNVKLTQKTVQSLTGSDSSEVAEIQPLVTNIKCEWTDRFLEKIKDGFRVWLRCRASKKAVKDISQLDTAVSTNKNGKAEQPRLSKYKRAMLKLAVVPTADRFIILSDTGERAIVEVKSNVENIELIDGDIAVVLRKQKFHDERVELGNWENGESLSRTVYLKPDL